MNYRVLGRILGLALVTEAALMVPSMLIGLYHGESILGFSTTIGILLIVGMLLLSFKPKDNKIFAREGFLGVSFSWILLSMFGALPFTIEKMIPDYVGAVFEVASGFTTTGASVLTAVEGCPYGLLFWRSFTNWVGGMGVLVFIMAVLPLADDRSMHIMRAEVPGPVVGKLVPKARQSAMILYGIYVVISILEVVFLLAGGMPLYDALVSTFATAGTGGFSVKALSIGYYDSAYIDIVTGIFMMLFGVNFNIAGYNSPYAEYVISVFLLLFSINFNLYFFILLRNIKPIFKNEELRWFLGIVAASVIAVAVNIRNMYPTVEEIIRKALFQVASIISTAGFSTADFDRWPELSRSILVCLMLIGACAGSTGGGIKVSRLIILLKSARCEVSRMMHPRSVNRVKLEGKTIDDEVLHNTLIFFVMYMLIVAVSTLLVASFDECDFTTNLTAVIACMGNIGPGLGKVGPMGNFSEFSALSKIVLTLDMLIGRLEIFPIIMVFTPETWKKV